MRTISPQRVDRGNTVTAGGSGRIQTTEELLAYERRRTLVLEERLAVLEKQVHTSTIRALISRAEGAETLASGLQARLMKLAEYVRQQKDKGNTQAEIEGLLTQQANNAENRVMTLQEELVLEKENAALLLEEIAVAKAKAQDLDARIVDYEGKIRDLEIRSLNSGQSDARAKAAEEKLAQLETQHKMTELKLTKLVELVKQEKEKEKEKEAARNAEREKDRAQIQQLQGQLAALQLSASLNNTLPQSPAVGARSSGSGRESELVEKLKAADARITKMTEVMRAADTKVRNAELWELRCKELEGANATLVARMRAIEEQTGKATTSSAQPTTIETLQAKLAGHEQKIRMLVETVKTERATFQRQLAEAKAGSTGGGSPVFLSPSPSVEASGPAQPAPPPPSPPPPPPPGGLKMKGPPKQGGSDLSSALNGVKLRSAQTDNANPDAPSPEPGRKALLKVPQLGTPAGNLGSIAEQALARRANLKPAPISPRGPLSAPPPPPPAEP